MTTSHLHAPDVQPEHLRREAEARERYLQVVSEKLGHHVMKNYGDFVRGEACCSRWGDVSKPATTAPAGHSPYEPGMNEVAAVDQSLAMAHVVAKNCRRLLARAETQIARDLSVGEQSQHKQQLLSLMAILGRLAEATTLRQTVKRQLAQGDFAASLLTCIESAQGLEALEGLAVVGELRDSTELLMQETLSHADGVLLQCCIEFDSAGFARVLEAYAVLGEAGELQGKIGAAFSDAILEKTQEAVRAFARLPETKGKATIPGAAKTLLAFQELVPLVPSDQFRPCVARALEAVFDCLANHHRMSQWLLQAARGDPLLGSTAGKEVQADRATLAHLGEVRSAAPRIDVCLVWLGVSRRTAMCPTAPLAAAAAGGAGAHAGQPGQRA